MDLALRLSEQEASATALRRQQEEEEAMMRAIKESVSTELEQACTHLGFISVLFTCRSAADGSLHQERPLFFSKTMLQICVNPDISMVYFYALLRVSFMFFKVS